MNGTADGSLIFDTEIDFSGIERAAERIRSLFSELASGGTGDPFKGLSDSLEGLAGKAERATPSIDKLADDAGRAADETDDLSQGAKQAAQNIDDMGESSQGSSGKIDALSVAMGNLISKGVELGITAIKECGTAYLDFGEEMIKVRTLLDESVLSYDDATAAVHRIARETGKSSQDIANGMYQALSAGVKSADVVTFMETAARSAKAGFTDVETAVDVLTSTMNAYGIEASDVLKVSDRLLLAQEKGKLTVGELRSGFGGLSSMAQTAGVSLEEVLAGLSALTAGGNVSSSAVASLQQVISSILKPTAEAQKEAERLGIEFNAGALKSKGLAGVLDDLRDKVGDNTDSMAKLFGSVEAYKAVASLAGEGTQTFTETLDGMENSAGKTAEVLQKMSDDPAVRFRDALNEIKTSLVEVGAAMAPVIGFLADAISLIAKVDPRVIALTIGITVLIGAVLTVAQAVSTVSMAMSLASMSGMAMNGSLMQTALIVMAVVLAFATLAGVIATIVGSGQDLEHVFKKTDRAVEGVRDKVTGTLKGGAGTGLGAFAHGTLSAPRGTAWVGERGPELVEFRGGERVYNATQSLAMAATATQNAPAVHVTNYNRIDAGNLAQVEQLIHVLNGESRSYRMGYVRG